MKYHLLTLTFLFLGSFSSFGQNETDLFRYSRSTFLGSARYEAMGGSFGALGADVSSSLVNPAGYGRFSTSQMGLSIFGGASTAKSTFNESTVKATQGLGGISNFAIVLTEDRTANGKGVLYRQLGFGVNRVENYASKIHYTGSQYASILDVMTSQANGFYPNELNSYFPFSTFLAYESYAINFDPSTNTYYSLLNDRDVIHDRTIASKGGQTEFFASYSLNYLNKLYFGTNIGFRYQNYQEDFTHTETLTDTSGTPLRSFTYTNELSTKGWGANIKIGAIYLFSEAFRVGLAIHSPTYSELTDNWAANMSATFDDSVKTIAETLIPTGTYKYKIRNPWRFVGSMAYVFGTRGCINIDAEFLDYRMSKFKSTKDQEFVPYDYAIENEQAKQQFVPAVNLRIGGEYILMSSLYLRAGFQYIGKAFNKTMQVENSADYVFSGGIGVKTQSFQCDLAIKHRMASKNYYAFSGSETVITQNSTLGVLSLGVFF
ncbi:MAG: outer membrane protein transport protein [Bacteroidota bacterium]